MYARDMVPCKSLERLQEKIAAGDEDSTVNVPRPQQSQLPRALMLCVWLRTCTPMP
jgi:hypothetical protein